MKSGVGLGRLHKGLVYQNRVMLVEAKSFTGKIRDARN
jgi:hypothetical protein